MLPISLKHCLTKFDISDGTFVKDMFLNDKPERSKPCKNKLSKFVTGFGPR